MRLRYGDTDAPTATPSQFPTAAPSAGQDAVGTAISAGSSVVGMSVGIALGSAALAALAVFVFYRRKRRVRSARADRNRASLELPNFDARGEGVTEAALSNGMVVPDMTSTHLPGLAGTASQPAMAGTEAGPTSTDAEWLGAFSSFNLALDGDTWQGDETPGGT